MVGGSESPWFLPRFVGFFTLHFQSVKGSGFVLLHDLEGAALELLKPRPEPSDQVLLLPSTNPGHPFFKSL